MEQVKKKLKDELSSLEDELHFKLPAEIQKAREFGDLRENAEYKAALERQSLVKGSDCLQVQQRLRELDSIDISQLPHDRIAYGSKVVLFDLEKEEKITYKLVTPEEGDPENGLLSTLSPIGSALIGKEEGDEIKVKTPTGFRSFEVARVTTIHEQD
jgi:transcription elongation factor GreA